jgi:hypothetical protein
MPAITITGMLVNNVFQKIKALIRAFIYNLLDCTLSGTGSGVTPS